MSQADGMTSRQTDRQREEEEGKGEESGLSERERSDLDVQPVNVASSQQSRVSTELVRRMLTHAHSECQSETTCC